MKSNKYIAYVRVSSIIQERDIQSQKKIISDNAGSENIEEWYTDIHSGKNLECLPQLIAAKEKAKEKGYTLIIAEIGILKNSQQVLDLVDELTPEGIWFCDVGRNVDRFRLAAFLEVYSAIGRVNDRVFNFSVLREISRRVASGMKGIGDPNNVIAGSTDKIMSKERLQEIAKELANNANMPYCWEDIYNRLIGGYPLPFKVEVK